VGVLFQGAAPRRLALDALRIPDAHRILDAHQIRAEPQELPNRRALQIRPRLRA
jgi:hypothetical protein